MKILCDGEKSLTSHQHINNGDIKNIAIPPPTFWQITEDRELSGQKLDPLFCAINKGGSGQ
jgi:hypothetical protein